MRSLAVLIVVAACSHPPAHAPTPSHVAPTWRGPEILAAVPADTPYMLGMLEPMAPPVRDQILTQTGVEILDGLHKLASGEGRGALVAAALYGELDPAQPGHWLEALGLSSDARFVVYGLSIWPVMRVEVKDEVRVRELLARIVKAGDPDLQPRSVGRAMIYVLDANGISIVFGIVGRELVASVLPSALVGSALPAIVGTELPARSLRDAPLLPQLLAQHHYVPSTVGFADTHRLFDALSGHGKGQFDQLDSIFEGKLPAACETDLGRIAAVLPRVVFGYRRLDARGFDGTLSIEAPRPVLDALAKLHAPMPSLPVKTQPLLAFAAAVNVDAAIGWMKDTTHALHAAPFRCEALAKVNEGVAELAAKLDQPLPLMEQGLRGFELVIDDATVLPPSGTGHLLVAGDHIAEIVHKGLAQVPQLASLQIPADGVAMELPMSSLGMPASFKSVHVALRPTRAAIAIGDGSSVRASGRTAAPDAHVPLLTMSFDVPKLHDRFGAFLKDMDFKSLSNIAAAVFSFDVADDGIDLEIVGTWSHAR